VSEPTLTIEPIRAMKVRLLAGSSAAKWGLALGTR
jgi:hypothetical protein